MEMPGNNEDERKELFAKLFDLDGYSGDPLTSIELKKIRKMLEAEARMDWMWSTIWVWSRALLITVGSIYFVREWLGDILGWVTKLIK
jgi:hypothetical protein